MKSYKISQTIEKNIYPIEAKIDALSESSREYLNRIFNIYAPVFLSAILTTAFGNSILSIPSRKSCSNKPPILFSLLSTWWGKTLCIIVLFTVFSVSIYFVCIGLHALSKRKDNKNSPEKRSHIAKEFYKVIVPEIITGASLFEKAYEIERSISRIPKEGAEGERREVDPIGDIDAEEIKLEELKEEESISNKATLYYYESFYHFKLVAERLEQLKIFEFKDSDRDELNQLEKLIGLDGLRKAIGLSRHCVIEICKRIADAEEKTISRKYNDFNRILLKEKPESTPAGSPE